MTRTRLGSRLFRNLVAPLIAVLLCLGAAPATATAVGPALTLKPASGPPTSPVKVIGSGFGLNEGVDVYFDSTDLVVTATSGTGSFTVTVHVPASAQPGTHYFTAVGRASGLSAQHTFTVRTDWPQYHYDVARTGSNQYENTLSQSNVAQLSEAWTFTTGAAVESSPAIVSGVVYIGSDDGNVYALNATTGALKWLTSLGSAIKSSPAVVKGVVYVGAENSHVYALNASNGSIKWNQDLSSFDSSGFDSAPAVVGGSVYIASTNNYEYSLDAAAGFVHWAAAMSCAGFASPSVGAGYVYQGGGCSLAQSFATSNGAAGPSDGKCLSCSLVYSNGRVFSGGFGEFGAYVATTGAPLWQTDAFGGNQEFGTSALAGGYVYVEASDGTAWSFPIDGSFTNWHTTVGGTNPSADSSMLPAPALANGLVILGGYDGTVDALSADSGAVLWSAATGGTVDSSPAVVNGQVYVGSEDGKVYAYHLPVAPVAPAKPMPNQLRPNLGLKPVVSG